MANRIEEGSQPRASRSLRRENINLKMYFHNDPHGLAAYKMHEHLQVLRADVNRFSESIGFQEVTAYAIGLWLVNNPRGADTFPIIPATLHEYITTYGVLEASLTSPLNIDQPRDLEEGYDSPIDPLLLTRLQLNGLTRSLLLQPRVSDILSEGFAQYQAGVLGAMKVWRDYSTQA